MGDVLPQFIVWLGFFLFAAFICYVCCAHYYSQEKGVYPENFANKRTYLEFIKKNKKQLKLDYFRLQCDLLEDLNGIPCNFFLCLTDITKIDKMLSIYGRFVFIDEISDKTLFEEGVLYHIGKK